MKMSYLVEKEAVEAKVVKEPSYRMIASGTTLYLGIGAAFFTVCIWACWLIVIKLGTQTALTSYDLALLRFGVPCVLLLPFAWQARKKIAAVPFKYLIGITCGAGVPFVFLSSTGMSFAPASHAGLLLPGTFPLFVTAIAYFFYKEPLSRLRLCGLIGIFSGIVLLLVTSLFVSEGQVWLGDLYLLGASLCWAIYTISLRVAGLPPLAASGLLSLVSLILLFVLFFLGDVDSGISQVSLDVIIKQVFVQSILVGVVAGFSYGFAINQLGAERTSAVGAFTPVLTSLLAIPLLGEIPTLDVVAGLILVGIGVVFASGIFRAKQY
jgi:drug/metabolite transporter (DMT)-like permease